MGRRERDGSAWSQTTDSVRNGDQTVVALDGMAGDALPGEGW